MYTFEHPHLTPEYLRKAKAAPPPPAEPFPRKRKGPRPISILGVHLPMLPVKMFPYYVILKEAPRQQGEGSLRRRTWWRNAHSRAF